MNREEFEKEVQFQKDFYKSRTHLWKLLLFVSVMSFLIGCLIWLFLSNDFAFYNSWKKIKTNDKLAISLAVNFFYFIFVLIIAVVLYEFNLIGEDVIMYSAAFDAFLLTNNLFGYVFGLSSTMHVIIRIILCFFVSFIVLFGSIFMSGLLKNNKLKKEESWDKIIEIYNKEGEVDDIKKYKIEKIINKRKEKEIKENLRLEKVFSKEQLKKMEYERKIKELKEKINKKKEVEKMED